MIVLVERRLIQHTTPQSLDYGSLEYFIKKKMSMTHIYQPVMIRTLLESKDYKASREEIARQFLGMDTSQLHYYEAIVGRWPHQTLKSHDIIDYNRKGKKYTLLLDCATREQKDRLIELCNLRLQEFIDKDPAIRRYREIDKRSLSGSVRYDILAKSKGVCVACGVTSKEAILHVDHIVPINAGGRNHPDNMQALCYKCNTQKRDRDATDFILWHKRLQFRKPRCNMCIDKKHDIENNMAYCVLSKNDKPSIVVPRRHTESFAELVLPERSLCLALVDRAIQHIKDHNTAIKRVDMMLDVPSHHYSIKLLPNYR